MRSLDELAEASPWTWTQEEHQEWCRYHNQTSCDLLELRLALEDLGLGIGLHILWAWQELQAWIRSKR